MSVVPIAPLFGTTYGSDLSGFSVFIPRGTRYIPICLAENIIANAIEKNTVVWRVGHNHHLIKM